MGGSGGSGAVLDCLLLLVVCVLLGFRMLIIEEPGTQGGLQLCDLRGGGERRSTCSTGAAAGQLCSTPRGRRPAAVHAPDLHRAAPAPAMAGLHARA